MSRKQSDDVSADGKCSPECLLTSEPVKDPYSTDEEQESCRKKKTVRHPNKYKLAGNSSPCKRPVVEAHTSSSRLSASEVLFFFDMDYMQYGEEVEIKNLPTTDLLNHIFDFVCSECEDMNEDPTSSGSVTKETKWNNETIQQMYERFLSENAVINWIAKHDTIEIKNYYSQSAEEFQKVLADCRNKPQEDITAGTLWFIQRWINWIVNLRVQCVKGFEDHDAMKGIFNTIEIIAKLPPILLNRGAEYSYNFCIPRHIASDDSGIFVQRQVSMTVKPDSIFTQYIDSNPEKTRNKIVLEVFSPNSKPASLTDSEDDDCSYQSDVHAATSKAISVSPIAPPSMAVKYDAAHSPVTKSPKTLEREIHYNKPNRTINAVQEEGYTEQARRYFSKRLPPLCLESDCVETLAGQHVLQLLGLAAGQGGNTEKKVIGLFAKNEYIFFTKLKISVERLFQIYGLDRNEEFNVIPRGKVAYSRWKLDLSLPKHRLALMIFLCTYLTTSN